MRMHNAWPKLELVVTKRLEKSDLRERPTLPCHGTALYFPTNIILHTTLFVAYMDQIFIMATTDGWNINLPLLSIPLYYVMAIFPHGYAVIIGAQGNLKRHDNRNPRSTTHIDSVRRRLSKPEYALWERAESCHRNHLENMPLFVAAIFAGLFAEQRVGKEAVGLNAFVAGWMVIRWLYTINYLTTQTIQWSYLRSLLYFIGSFWAFYIIGTSALIVGR